VFNLPFSGEQWGIVQLLGRRLHPKAIAPNAINDKLAGSGTTFAPAVKSAGMLLALCASE